MATWPTPEQIEAFLAGPADRPVVMLNILELADETDGAPTGASGEEAMMRYARGMRRFVESRGGSFVFAGRIDSQLIGRADEAFGFVSMMRYPSRAAFLELAGDPDIAATIGKDRDAGLKSQWLFALSEVDDDDGR